MTTLNELMRWAEENRVPLTRKEAQSALEGDCVGVGESSVSRKFTAAMAPRDIRKMQDYERRYREWKFNDTNYSAYVLAGGAAPAGHWHGPIPSEPGDPPVKPLPKEMLNTACQAANRIGAARIFRELAAKLKRRYRCVGNCKRRKRCKIKLTRSRGIGHIDLENGLTYCLYQLSAECECS